MRRFAAFTAFLLLPAAAALGQVCTPVVLDTVSSPGALARPVIYGSSAYVAGGGAGIVRVDVSQPDALVVAGTAVTSGNANDITLEYQQGELVVAEGSSGLSVWSVGADGAPSLDERIALSGAALSVAGSGGQYVVGTQQGSLITVTSSGGLTTQGSVAVGGPVHAVAASLTRAYAAADTAGLVVVDLTSRTNPVVVTTLDLGGAVTSVLRDRNNLYCGVAGIGIVSIAIDGDTLMPQATLSTGGAPTDFALHSGRLYAAIPGSGLMVADVSLSGTILQLGTLSLDGATAMALSGNDLFVGRGSNGFTSVDIGDCANVGVQATTRFIPAAARATGAANTYWVTDVAMSNFTAAPATASVAYLAKGQANPTPQTVTFVIQPGQQTMLADVMQQAFGLNKANGALRIITSHPDVKVTSRTYNAAGESGTYGQFIPAFTEDDAAVPGVPGVLLQLQENSGFRSNLGLLNISGQDVDVSIDLYRGSGELLGTRTQALRPYEMVQIDRVFNAFSNAVDSGYAVVKTDAGKVLVYASVVDNGSGDPVYIPAQLLVPGTPFGG